MSAVDATLLKDIWEETNFLRSRPKEFADMLAREVLPLYQGMYFCKPGEIRIVTQEGPAAVQECIDFCRKQPPVPPLEYPRYVGMNKASQDHCNDCGPKGLLGHDGSDGSQPATRLERYGKWLQTCGENISYGTASGKDIVRQLAIDDGVPSRGHRTNLFNPQFKVMSVGFGPHSTFRVMCTLNYAGGYVENAPAPPPPPPGQGKASAPPPPPHPRTPPLPVNPSIRNGVKSPTPPVPAQQASVPSENDKKIASLESTVDQLKLTVESLTQKLVTMQKEIDTLKTEVKTLSKTPPATNSLPMGNRITTPEVQYRTLYNFSGRNATELTYVAQETLTFVSQDRDGWLKCRNSKGVEGLVHETYVKKV